MAEIITACVIIFGGGTALFGLKYLLFKCDKEHSDQLIIIEEEEEHRLVEHPPPKYEDIVQ